MNRQGILTLGAIAFAVVLALAVLHLIPDWHILDGSTVQAGSAQFSNHDALIIAENSADEAISNTIGRPSSYGSKNIPALAIRLSNMELKGFRFEPNTESVTSAFGSRNTFPVPENVWIADWEQTGVPISEWGISNGIVRVEIIIEDGTGKVLSANVGKSKPTSVK